MSVNPTSIYSEALIEAKKLREVAEANAKKVLIEAVTPRVREMIEKQLLGESIAEGDIMEDVAADLNDEDENEKDVIADGHDKSADSEDDDEDLLLSKESVDALNKLRSEGTIHPSKHDDYVKRVFPSKLEPIMKKLKFAKELSETKACSNAAGKRLFGNLINKLIKETKTLRTDMISIVGKEPTGPHKILESGIKKIQKEIIQMASKKLLKEGSEMYEIDLSELDSDMGDEIDLGSDDEVSDEMPMDMGGETEEAADVTISGDLAQQLLAAIEGQVAEPSEDEIPAEDEVEEEGAEDEGDVEDDTDEEEEEIEEGEDEMVEIDEAMLKRELARMRGLSLRETSEKPPGGKMGRAAAANVVKQFGGATTDKEVFVDGEDSDLNVNEEIKKLKISAQNESRKNRTLRSQVEGYKQTTAKLQEQLEQMNLFNAKLLYVNKLMANESVTSRQKKTIVEALDKAKNLNEVKHLYKVLSESLAKGRPAKADGTMNESAARRTASPSRAMQSGGASRTDIDPQVDRWATLAGISKDKK